MESKVLSIRFKVTDIAACYKILQAGGFITSEHSPGTAIRLILESSIAQQVKLKVIPELDEEYAIRILEEIGKDEPDEIVQPASLIDTLHELYGGGEVEPNLDKYIKNPETLTEDIEKDFKGPHARVLDELNKVSEPEISLPVEIADEVEEPIEKSVDIWSMTGKPLDELEKISPQDHIIKTYKEDDKGDKKMRENFQKCIEIIYARIPEEQWGTEKAQKLINNLYQEAM